MNKSIFHAMTFGVLVTLAGSVFAQDAKKEEEFQVNFPKKTATK